MENNLSDVMRAIGALEGTMQTGFEGVNQRLDFANGRLNKHDDEISSLQLTRSENIGKDKALGWVGSVIAGAIGLIAGLVGSFVQSGKL